MTDVDFTILKKIAATLRLEDIKAIATAQSGHPGGSLSIIELLTVLYFAPFLKYEPQNPTWPERDRLVLSKGHTCPALYCTLAYAGFFPKEELATFRKFGSRLQGHTDLNMKTPGVETCGGPLGQGLSVALGMAIAGKIDGKAYKVYTIIGDGESAKGGITEAAKCAGVRKMDNMIAFLDYNKVDQDGAVKDVLPCQFEKEWQSYGWQTLHAKGDDVEEIFNTIQAAHTVQKKEEVPVMILLDTIKGAGISFMADAARRGDPAWHGVAPKGKEYETAIAECEKEIEKFNTKYPESVEAYIAAQQKNLPKTIQEMTIQKPKSTEKQKSAPEIIPFSQPTATRDAFGKYIAALGKADPQIVTVTAGVCDSVKLEEFAKEFGTFSATNRSGRFVQVGIAEANMAGVAAGLALSDKKPWMATFDIFVKECLGVIRNAICYANIDVKIIGTHAGLGVEWDGGSHQSTIVSSLMADLFRMESYEPADAHETQEIMKLVYLEKKAAYLRLTRQKLPLYPQVEITYKTGARVIKKSEQQKIMLLGSGAGLEIAMNAAAVLEKNNIPVSVIDVFSLSHLNTDEFRALIPATILLATVHDAHYKILGREVAYSLAQIGQANKIMSFGMQDFGESGSVADLYKKHGMDVEWIVKRITQVLAELRLKKQHCVH